jgi:hypothetical protein
MFHATLFGHFFFARFISNPILLSFYFLGTKRGLSRQEKILRRNDCHFRRCMHKEQKVQPTHQGDSMSGSFARFVGRNKRFLKFGIA